MKKIISLLAKVIIIRHLLILIFFLFLFILISFLSFCREDTTQLAKDEFSKYFSGKDEVVLINEDNLYFENYIVNEESFNPWCYYDTIIFYEDLIYYISISSPNKNLKYLNIYSCDYYGHNANVIYSREINAKINEIKKYKDSYFIEYKKEKLVYIEKYTISTGIYETVAIGKDCSLSDYVPKKEQSGYTVEVIENISPQEHGKFIVTDIETGAFNVIDDEYLKNTIYIESMEKFNYGPERVDISNGHILLTYGIGAGDGWNFPYLVFEYDFDTNTIEYKLLAFPYDSVPIEIVYIG